jgi:hypothetical protein
MGRSKDQGAERYDEQIISHPIRRSAARSRIDHLRTGVDLELRLFPVDTLLLVRLEVLAVLIIVRDRMVEVAKQMTAHY